MKPRISMIALGVSDLARARMFYEEGLGLPVAETPPGVVFFELNGTWLGLSERTQLALDAGLDPEGEGYSGINLIHNVASETEVDVALESAVQAGGRLVKSAAHADWGGYHGYFADPDGHLWEVAHNPYMWIGPKDD